MSGGPGWERIKELVPARWRRVPVEARSTHQRLMPFGIPSDLCSPLGMYVARAEAVGTGSRGRVSLTVEYDPAHLFSLEGYEAYVHGDPGDGCLVFWQPGFMIDERTNFGLVWHVELRAARGVTRWMNRGRDVITHHLPVSRSEPGAFPAVFSVEFERNVDRVIYVTNLWGYYWDRAALDLPGGPVRPGAAARAATDTGPC